MEFILSDSSQVNSNGFRTQVENGDFTRFNANPVMLYAHDTTQVIGRWTNLKVEGGKLIASTDFDLEDPNAKEIARKVKSGYLRGCSIGMKIRKMELLDDVWVVTDWELTEASICAIPSDAGAIRLFNEQYQEIQFEDVKLNFNDNNNNQNEQKMSKAILLSMVCAASLGLGDEYTPKDVELAVAEKDKKITELEATLSTERQGAMEHFLNQAESDGKITAEEKIEFLALAKVNFVSVQKLVNAKQEQARTSLKDMAQRTQLLGVDSQRLSWTYFDWMKNDPKGLQKLKQENPKYFEQLELTLKN